jgi:hypothetical protein
MLYRPVVRTLLKTKEKLHDDRSVDVDRHTLERVLDHQSRTNLIDLCCRETPKISIGSTQVRNAKQNQPLVPLEHTSVEKATGSISGRVG